MGLKKFMGWAVAMTLVLGVPALTAALDGKAGGGSGAGVFEERTGMGGDTSGSGSSSLERSGGRAFAETTGMGGDTSRLENKGGMVLAEAESSGSSAGSVSPEAQGMNPTGTGPSGTSPDSTTQTGRGEMAPSGGTQEMTPDAMGRGMQNRTGMTPTPSPHPGGPSGSSGY